MGKHKRSQKAHKAFHPEPPNPPGQGKKKQRRKSSGDAPNHSPFQSRGGGRGKRSSNEGRRLSFEKSEVSMGRNAPESRRNDFFVGKGGKLYLTTDARSFTSNTTYQNVKYIYQTSQDSGEDECEEFSETFRFLEVNERDEQKRNVNKTIRMASKPTKHNSCGSKVKSWGTGAVVYKKRSSAPSFCLSTDQPILRPDYEVHEEETHINLKPTTRKSSVDQDDENQTDEALPHDDLQPPPVCFPDLLLDEEGDIVVSISGNNFEDQQQGLVKETFETDVQQVLVQQENMTFGEKDEEEDEEEDDESDDESDGSDEDSIDSDEDFSDSDGDSIDSEIVADYIENLIASGEMEHLQKGHIYHEDFDIDAILSDDDGENSQASSQIIDITSSSDDDIEILSVAQRKKEVIVLSSDSEEEIEELLCLEPKKESLKETVERYQRRNGNMNGKERGNVGVTYQSSYKYEMKMKRKEKKEQRRNMKLQNACGKQLQFYSDLNDLFHSFLHDSTLKRMRLPEGLNNFERSKVHELASLYGMNSNSYGSGKGRYPMIEKTVDTRLPHPQQIVDWQEGCIVIKPNTRNKVIDDSPKKSRKMNAKERRKAARAELFAQHQTKAPPASNKHQRGKSKSAKKTMSTPPSGGYVVGGNAAPISTENVGNRLLRGMGWSGGGLGANKQGLEAPIQATVKNNRFGIGF